MNKNKISIYAPIIPNHSIGNIILGENIENYVNLDISDDYEIIDIFSDGRGYKIKNIPILIYIDDNSKTIFKLSAINGYLGGYLNEVFIGMKAKDVLSKNLGFSYDLFYEGLIKDDGTILLEFSFDIPWDENTNILELEVAYITIFDKSKLLF